MTVLRVILHEDLAEEDVQAVLRDIARINDVRFIKREDPNEQSLGQILQDQLERRGLRG